MGNKCDCDSVFLDNENKTELCGCEFEIDKVLKNVTVEVLRCSKCGKISIGWYRQKDTEDVTDNFYNENFISN